MIKLFAGRWLFRDKHRVIKSVRLLVWDSKGDFRGERDRFDTFVELLGAEPIPWACMLDQPGDAEGELRVGWRRLGNDYVSVFRSQDVFDIDFRPELRGQPLSKPRPVLLSAYLVGDSTKIDVIETVKKHLGPNRDFQHGVRWWTEFWEENTPDETLLLIMDGVLEGKRGLWVYTLWEICRWPSDAGEHRLG